ncbi:MAG: SagB/ThcOx family dehydrogenase [Propionicimonas sp.]|uniref:SagB/ThcOx family dehydrogenase n=1 Tax=Propionicimonas sp. TaxID=1955623 RepID=UPI003D0EC5E1
MTDDFWTASAITPVAQSAFGARIAAFDPGAPVPDPWSRPGELVPLPPTADPLDEVVRNRRSGRQFAPSPLSADDLGAVLGALAADADGHRSYPAAGALYAVTVVAWLYRVEHPLHGRTVQFDPLQRALVDLGPAPTWAEESVAVTGEPAGDPPPVLLGLFANLDVLRAKYGDRGDRFALLEAGEILQVLSLAVAARHLAGYAIGGSVDQRMIALAHLPATGARFVISYAFGRPA